MKIKLNLIPPYRREEIKKAKTLRRILKWEFELAGIMVIFIAMLFSLNYILQINFLAAQNNPVLNGKDNNQIQKIGEYDAKIRDVNTQISLLGKIQGGQLYWTNFLEKLDNAVPGDIAISNFTTQNYDVTLTGNAKDRDTLIAFKDNLSKDNCFSNIDLPLSNLVAKENVNFQINFSITNNCLQKNK